MLIIAIVLITANLLLLILNRYKMKVLERKINANRKILDREEDKRHEMEADMVSYLRARGMLFKESEIEKILIDSAFRSTGHTPNESLKMIDVKLASQMLWRKLNSFDRPAFEYIPEGN